MLPKLLKKRQGSESWKYVASDLSLPVMRSFYDWVKNNYPNLDAVAEAKSYESNYANWDRAGYIGGTLPDVVVIPDRRTSAAVAHAKEMFPDKIDRRRMYRFLDNCANDHESKTSLNDAVNRLHEIYSRAKKPRTTRGGSLLVNTFGLLLDKENKYRANYNLATNVVYLPTEGGKDLNVEDYISELSHAYQSHADDPLLSKYGLNSFLSLPGDIKIKGRDGYDRPGNNEFSAHRIIEPAIYRYIYGFAPSFRTALDDYSRLSLGSK